jgi:2-hydroxy-3-oxopropionate reductase
MSAGPLHSGMMDFIKAYAIDGNPDLLAFSIRNAAKDVGYYNQMMQGLGADSVMSRGAHDALTSAIDEGMGDRLVPEMVDYFARRTGV